MNRRRTPTPSPSKDWRALAVPPVQRGLALPVRTSGDTVTDDPPAEPEDVELRLRRDDDGARVTLVASVVYSRGDELRGLAERLHEAADALDTVAAP